MSDLLAPPRADLSARRANPGPDTSDICWMLVHTGLALDDNDGWAIIERVQDGSATRIDSDAYDEAEARVIERDRQDDADEAEDGLSRAA